ncbi:hypothetical protein AAG570_002966 [Ranatra chinensis]|uniref:Suppressor of fused homolog n=1 Tax=Ranatra chinensis TaxID=642074 RepID=A0ABD0YTW4_9HEMI
MVEAEKSTHRGLPINVLPQSPPGLESLYLACRRIYPDQPNPLQVAALVKYWLGGPDPLDYISMYSNLGNTQLGVPPHWHYVSFGLSDLHGDGRVHQTTGPGGFSGFGFELTFRLKREPGETAPPTWPATLLQALAKYVFHSGNTVCAGDHVSWHSALDGSGESLIQHMLMTVDPQLETAQTPCGSVTFIQVVGVCKEELQAAQKWNGLGVLDILKTIPSNQVVGSYNFQERFESTELLQTKKLESLHLTFNLESGSLLPLAIRGRVKHGRHFTFKSVLGNAAITLVAESVTGTFVNLHKPYVSHGPWLQVLIPEDFISEILKTLQPLTSNTQQV